MAKEYHLKDGTTIRQKILLRQMALKRLESAPVVMETHGGFGFIYQFCYSGAKGGVVFEKDPKKADFLALQRPTWSVYETDCTRAIGDGAGAHLAVNVLDVDPYGDPWPAIEAFFGSERPRESPIFVIVNDGLRLRLKMGAAWKIKTLRPMVRKYGHRLHAAYLKICEEMMVGHVRAAGYEVDRFAGYYCGHSKQMTHYLAILRQA